MMILHEHEDFINNLMYDALEADLMVGESVDNSEKVYIKKLTTNSFAIFRKYVNTNAHIQQSSMDEIINNIYKNIYDAKAIGKRFLKSNIMQKKDSNLKDFYRKVDIDSFPVITRNDIVKVENEYDIEGLRKVMLENPNPKKFFNDLKKKPTFSYSKYMSKLIKNAKYDTDVKTTLNKYFDDRANLKIPFTYSVPSIQVICNDLNDMENYLREYRDAYRGVITQFNNRLSKLDSLENEYKKIVMNPNIKGANLLTLDVSQYYKDLETIKGIQYIYFLSTYMSFIADIYSIAMEYYGRFFMYVYVSVLSMKSMLENIKEEIS